MNVPFSSTIFNEPKTDRAPWRSHCMERLGVHFISTHHRVQTMMLPNHSESRISDPLSVVPDGDDSEDGLVSFWDFLNAVLGPLIDGDVAEKPLLSGFKDALETIAWSRGVESTELDILFSFAAASESEPGLLSPWLVQRIAKQALRMKYLFPDGILPDLQTKNGEGSVESGYMKPQPITLTHQQIDCLISHMILGTLSPPPWPLSWNAPNFGPIWFSSETAGNNGIKKDYVTVLLSYLHEAFQDVHDREHKEVTYQISRTEKAIPILSTPSNATMKQISLAIFEDLLGGTSTAEMIPLKIIKLDEEDDDHEGCFKVQDEGDWICQLIAANKEVGFGPTGTQEERIFAATPILLPSVLVTPPLSESQALLVDGDTEVYAHFKGHLRTARLDGDNLLIAEVLVKGIYTTPQRREQARTGRRFLFLDALEMDEDAHGKDLDWVNVSRELRKLICGFKTLDVVGEQRKTTMVIPPWGCGAFGGDFHIKLLLIWIAASAYDDTVRELRLVVKKSWWETLDSDWRTLIDLFENFTLEGVWEVFSSLMMGYDDNPNQMVDWHGILSRQ